MSESNEIAYTEVVGIVQHYAKEPLRHAKDEGKDDEADQDSLIAAMLRAQFETQVDVNDWLGILLPNLLFIAIFSNNFCLPYHIRSKHKSMTFYINLV